MGTVLYMFDQLVLDGMVRLVGFVPKLGGYAIRPAQNGKLQGYGVSMTVGLAVILLIVFYAWTTL